MPSDAQWSGSPSIKGSTEAMRMARLTFSLVGLQFTWGIEMTYCTPYLLQLGLTKSKTSLVWIAGPLSGLVMQPIVGAIADRSTSKYGRRRPFMVWGSILVAACLLLLGWTTEIVGIFISDEERRKRATIITAVFSIYAVDFAINAVQACCRSLIVDTLPISQQQLGSAWASRMAAGGHFIGYMIGTFNLGTVLEGMFGSGNNQQFKAMTLIAASSLLAAVGVTCYSVSERILLPSSRDMSSKTKTESIFNILSNLFHRTIHLPPRIRSICWVQFWSWIGWFPFMFYSTTWVGETYYRYEHPPQSDSATTDDSHDALGNIGRIGSLSLVIFSIVTFASSVLLPYVVKSPTQSASGSIRDTFTPRPPKFIPKALQEQLVRLSSWKPDLVTAWLLSNLYFACTMVWAPMVHSLAAATTIVALAGIPWAISSWAPFAEMGVEITRLASDDSSIISRPTNIIYPSGAASRGAYSALRPSLDQPRLEDDGDDIELQSAHQHRRAQSEGVLHIDHPDTDDAHASTGELAGVYLGVLNVYTTLPQFVGTFVSWIVFTLLEPSTNDDSVADDDPEHHRWLDLKKDAPNAIAVCLFVGACCSLVAVEATRRLKRFG